MASSDGRRQLDRAAGSVIRPPPLRNLVQTQSKPVRAFSRRGLGRPAAAPPRSPVQAVHHRDRLRPL